MASGQKDDQDRILRGLYSDELEAKAASFQQLGCSQDPLAVVPAPTNNAGNMAQPGPSEGRTGERREGGHCQGLLYRSLSDATPKTILPRQIS